MGKFSLNLAYLCSTVIIWHMIGYRTCIVLYFRFRQIYHFFRAYHLLISYILYIALNSLASLEVLFYVFTWIKRLNWFSNLFIVANWCASSSMYTELFLSSKPVIERHFVCFVWTIAPIDHRASFLSYVMLHFRSDSITVSSLSWLNFFRNPGFLNFPIAYHAEAGWSYNFIFGFMFYNILVLY